MPEQGPDPIIDRIAAQLRGVRGPGAAFDVRVMAAVRAVPPSRLRLAWSWLREPQTLALSPLGGLAAAAVLIGVLGVGFRGLGGRGTDPGVAATTAPRNLTPHTLSFVFVAPAAQSVALAGDFNGWDPSRTPLVRAASGLWTVEIPLAPGRYSYAFVVDGRRFEADPAAPRAAGDDFGTPTSVITVADGGSPAGGSL